MRIETQVLVEAPPLVVFDFFAWLDHLTLVSPARRSEWCPTPGQRAAQGRSHEVILNQGRHRIRLRFVTEVFRPGERIVDLFTSWPLNGARRTLSFHAEELADGRLGTRLVELDAWRPPFMVRALVGKRLEQQRDLFEEKLHNAKRIVERAYRSSGEDVFRAGVVEPVERLGLLTKDCLG